MSSSSPATGVESRGRQRAAGSGEARFAPEVPLDVELHHARWPRLAGAVVAGGVAPVAFYFLGGVGVVIGLAAMVSAIGQALDFARTLRYPPGTIQLTRGQVVLPIGLCGGRAATVPIADVRHVLLLRRAVPYSAGGSLLVVETTQGIFEYPRPWFASEDDALRVAVSLRHLAGRA